MQSKQKTKECYQAPNVLLNKLPKDALYHLALDTESDNFKKMFSDIKYVCFGGSTTRMKNFAHFIAEELQIDMPSGMTLYNIAKGTDRYVMYKAGPVLSVNHGMGMPSLSIIFHEIVKLVHYAECANVRFIRLGTCGGLGPAPGSVVITDCALDGLLNPFMEVKILGKVQKFPGTLDENLAKELLNFSDPKKDGFETLIGKTMCTDDFYEGQGRLDGAFCGYTEEDKMTFLEKVHSEGIRNIEMESLCFAAYCNRANITGAVVCVTVVDRLVADLITASHGDLDDWQKRPQILLAKLIKSDLGIE